MDNFAQEFRIHVRGLTVGMFVARLDRAWLGTSYPLEGFKIDSEEDLLELQKQCNHVYVDVSRGASPDPRYVELEVPDLVKHARGHDEIASLHKIDWPLKSDFRTELEHAEVAHDTLRLGIEEVMEDVQNGQDLQIDKLKTGVNAMIDSITRNPSAFIWLKAIKKKDNYTYQHALACSVWAASFGRHLGMDRAELAELALCGLLFDVGKTRVSSSLLSQSTSLSDHECSEMRRHVAHGVDILSQTAGVSPRIIEAVATHHERHDGSGYPHGLTGLEIPMFGRIIGLIDSYNAMISIRPFTETLSPHHAVMDLYQARDRLFQSELVEHFIQTCGIYPSGSLVELSDGRVGVVTAVHSLKRLRPSVMLLLDADKKALRQFVSVDLSDDLQEEEGGGLSIKRGLPQGAYGVNPAELFLD